MLVVFIIADSNPYMATSVRYSCIACLLVFLAVRGVEGLVIQTASAAVLANAVHLGRKRSVSVACELTLSVADVAVAAARK